MSVARPTPWKRRPLYETTISTAQRVAAMALGGQLVFHQLDRVVGDAIDCLINRIDRAIAGGGLGFLFAAADQFHRGGGHDAAAGLHAEVARAEVLRLFLLFIDEGERLRVIVEHGPFVGQLQEGGVQGIRL